MYSKYCITCRGFALKRMLIAIIVLGCMVFSLGIAQAKTLGELLPELLAKHERLKSADQAIESAKQLKRVAEAAKYPSLTVTGDMTREEISKPAVTQKSTTIYNRNTQTVTVNQLLYDFGSADAAVAAQQVAVTISEANRAMLQQGLIFEGVVAYLEALKAYRKLQTDRDSVTSLRKQVGLEQKQVDSGAGQIQSVLQAQQQLTATRARQVSNEGALINAGHTYRKVFGEGVTEDEVKDFKRPPRALRHAAHLAGRGRRHSQAR